MVRVMLVLMGMLIPILIAIRILKSFACGALVSIAYKQRSCLDVAILNIFASGALILNSFACGALILTSFACGALILTMIHIRMIALRFIFILILL